MAKLAARRDLLYVGFFLIHAISTLVIDIQPLLPDALRIGLFKSLLDFYLRQTNDPLMTGARLHDPDYLWFRWFLLHEVIFFTPCFVLGIRGLLKGTTTIYPLLLAYGAAASTTTATCVVVLVFGHPKVPLNHTQLSLLLSSYIPFFVIPAIILVDMYNRVHRLINPRTQKSPKKKL